MKTAFETLSKNLLDKPQRWVVTGAAGFIGSHLVETLLHLQQEVVGIDNLSTGYRHNLAAVQAAVGEESWSRFKFVEADVNEGAVLVDACAGASYVLHEAALGSVPRSISDPLSSNKANIDGTLQVLWAAKEAGVRRVVYASSSSVYGDSEQLPKTEDVIGTCLSPYAVTKRVNELYASVFESCYGFESIGLRYFNVFGPRQDPKGAYAAVIPRWVDAIRNEGKCIIFGDGETSRDFCYVANVVQANLLAAAHAGEDAAGQVYNIAVGGRTTLKELHTMIVAAVVKHSPSLEVAAPEYHDFRAGDIRHSHADIGLAERLLGYQPEVAVEEGIERTVQWFLSN